MKSYSKIVAPLEKIKAQLNQFVASRQEAVNKKVSEIEDAKVAVEVMQDEITKAMQTSGKIGNLIG